MQDQQTTAQQPFAISMTTSADLDIFISFPNRVMDSGVKGRFVDENYTSLFLSHLTPYGG
jgi:hypothetical protein